MTEKPIFKKRKKWVWAFSLIPLVIVTYSVLLLCGVVHINNPDPETYPVAGVDVSSYQGEIDWGILTSQDIKFAFIKATEGSSYIDEYFEKNWAEASKTDLRIGAYHFFSFESPGETQADLFCGTVTPVDNMLPPVIDVEYYGNYKSEKDIDVSQIRRELRVLTDRLTASYGVKPILYATKKSYDTILQDNFSDCGLWIRSVYSEVRSDIDWTFWQYSDRHLLPGYAGKERFIDMNVFCGTVEEFAAYPAEKE